MTYMLRFAAVGAVLLAACGGDKKPEDSLGLPACATPVSGEKITTRRIGRVASAAMLATSPPADLRLFVVEQRGAIRIFKDDQLLPEPFLDLSADAAGPVDAGGEKGLLGLAFHPKYATNGFFYVFYTTAQPTEWRDVVARCSVSVDNPDKADRASCVEILSIDDFASNHNGGMIEFGKDGMLYIGTGDGGGANDPRGTGQDLQSLLGKLLRIDVDGTNGSNGMYGIPADNPFAGGGGSPEIFIVGLRNPWRWSFDRMTGDLWIGDVGQDRFEELNYLPAGQQSGKNLGWSMYEGSSCFREPCDGSGKTFPQDERERNATGWISIIAGQTYRGTCYPDIVGWHFYSDYGVGGLVKARPRTDGTLEIVELEGTFPSNPSSIHEDARGEIFITTTAGDIYHLEAAP